MSIDASNYQVTSMNLYYISYTYYTYLLITEWKGFHSDHSLLQWNHTSESASKQRFFWFHAKFPTATCQPSCRCWTLNQTSSVLGRWFSTELPKPTDLVDQGRYPWHVPHVAAQQAQQNPDLGQKPHVETGKWHQSLKFHIILAHIHSYLFTSIYIYWNIYISWYYHGMSLCHPFWCVSLCKSSLPKNLRSPSPALSARITGICLSSRNSSKPNSCTAGNPTTETPNMRAFPKDSMATLSLPPTWQLKNRKLLKCLDFVFWLKATLNLQESATYVHPKLFKGVQVSLSNRPPPSTSTVCNRVTEKTVWFVICLSPVVWFVTKAPQSAFAELPGPWPEWRRLKSRANHPFHATNQNRNT